MAGYAVTPQFADVYAALQPFIATVTGLSSILVIQGLPNRSAMPPAAPGFISMELTVSGRLRTNIDSYDVTNPDPISIAIEQGTKLRLQLDCYGAAAADWAVILSTLLRDDVGCVALAPTAQPLYTDEPMLAPLDDSEAQYEQRWILQAYLQYNPVVTAPMQFADQLNPTLINVDASYPA